MEFTPVGRADQGGRSPREAELPFYLGCGSSFQVAPS